MAKPSRNQMAGDVTRVPVGAAGKKGGTSPELETSLDWLKRHGTQATRDGMGRFAIPSDRAFGVTMKDIQALAKRLGRSHVLAAQLWASGWYEARMLASYVDDPACVTPHQMDQWSRDFDNWAVCDTVCFALFDRTPHAWGKVEEWSRREAEYPKRAAFALLWGLSVHDKKEADDRFLKALSILEREASDERHYVKKAVNMALRGIGKRNAALHAAALAAAERLAASTEAAARWVGKDAFRELSNQAVTKRLAGKIRKATSKS